jgi:hypothetical protein
MEASIGQLKKDKQFSLSELKKLQADMTSAIQQIKVITVFLTSLMLRCGNIIQ